MPAKLRILLILIEPPLPFGNAGSRWFHVLYDQLRNRGHKVQVLVASGVDKDIQKAREVFSGADFQMDIFPFEKSKTWLDKVKSLIHPHRSKFSQEFVKRFHELEPDSFDIIHVEQTWAGWVPMDFAEKTLLNIHYLQAIDLQYVVPNSWKEKLLFKRYFQTEKSLISHYPNIRTCTPRLEKKILAMGKKNFVSTVPFGIDLTLYPFIQASRRQQKSPIVTLIGNMGWYPSVSAAERLLTNIWPSIQEQIPSAKCKIVGWQARTALHKYLDLPNVEILENVPDIQPYFEEASVLVYPPKRGSGMKIKVQEAMAFGIPVVTTFEGAEGLPAKDMEHMGLCDNDNGIVSRAVDILKNPELQERLRKNARKLVENHCDPEITVTAIENLYAKIVAKK